MRVMRKSGLLVLRDHRLLVVRKQNTTLYLLPGGRLEEGESYPEALAREIQEELGCTLQPGSVQYFSTFEDVAANEPDSIINIHAYWGELVGEPGPRSEIVELYWFGADSDRDKLSPIIRNKVLPALLELNLL